MSDAKTTEPGMMEAGAAEPGAPRFWSVGKWVLANVVAWAVVWGLVLFWRFISDQNSLLGLLGLFWGFAFSAVTLFDAMFERLSPED